jgi:hypothetical protein
MRIQILAKQNIDLTDSDMQFTTMPFFDYEFVTLTFDSAFTYFMVISYLDYQRSEHFEMN